MIDVNDLIRNFFDTVVGYLENKKPKVQAFDRLTIKKNIINLRLISDYARLSSDNYPKNAAKLSVSADVFMTHGSQDKRKYQTFSSFMFCLDNFYDAKKRQDIESMRQEYKKMISLNKKFKSLINFPENIKIKPVDFDATVSAFFKSVIEYLEKQKNKVESFAQGGIQKNIDKITTIASNPEYYSDISVRSSLTADGFIKQKSSANTRLHVVNKFIYCLEEFYTAQKSNRNDDMYKALTEILECNKRWKELTDMGYLMRAYVSQFIAAEKFAIFESQTINQNNKIR